MSPPLPVPPELAATANCAGAFLMLVAFALLAVVAVALHFVLRGMIASRRNLPEAMSLVAATIGKLQAGTEASSAALVAPQVTVASRWAGLRRTARVLLFGPGQAPPPAAPPAGPGAAEGP